MIPKICVKIFEYVPKFKFRVSTAPPLQLRTPHVVPIFLETFTAPPTPPLFVSLGPNSGGRKEGRKERRKKEKAEFIRAL